MAFYRIQYIDGHDLQYKTFETEADSVEKALHSLWQQDSPSDFDHQIISVNEIPLQKVKEKIVKMNNIIICSAYLLTKVCIISI